jgi:hypothetical protein
LVGWIALNRIRRPLAMMGERRKTDDDTSIYLAYPLSPFSLSLSPPPLQILLYHIRYRLPSKVASLLRNKKSRRTITDCGERQTTTFIIIIIIAIA